MFQTVRDACKPSELVQSLDLTRQIENLDQLLADEARDASAFFARNFVTKGMKSLFEEGLKRLAGQSDQCVFELRQAMGGGKTHSMVALGLLARDAATRRSILPDLAKAYPFGSAKVVAISGRERYDERFIWGEIAQRLGKASEFSKFWSNGAAAPGEADWIALIGDEPTLILLDELPPYFDYAITRTVGGGTLSNVTTFALSNLLSAATKLKACAIVISDLSATYESASQNLRRAVANFEQESNRQARKLTPVELGSNEIYDILRKRLFEKLPSEDVVAAVAAEYGRLLGEATRAKAVAKSAEQIADEIHGSYPFHPSVKEVVALFRENEKFRQTRGLMQFISKLIKSVWLRDINDVYLIGCQHLDLRHRDVREEVRRISDLQDAISHDICNEDEETAKAQLVDQQVGNDSASQIASMILTASLSESVEGVKGLTFSQATEYLIAPNRPASDFINAFDSFKALTWFLHKKENEAWYFSKLENLNKRLENRAKQAPIDKIEKFMREKLEEAFKPISKAAYEKVMALPPLDSINLSGGRVCLVLSPDTKFPPVEAQRYFDSITEKNNLLIVTGDGSDLASLEEKARRVWAIERVRSETGGETSPHRAELDDEAEKAAQAFNSTVIAMFNRIFYPAYDRNRRTAVLQQAKLSMQFMSNRFNAEEQIEKALSDTAVSKLYPNIEANATMLLQRAERDLWPGGTKRTRWNDVLTEARSRAVWLWLPPRGLETLKEIATGQSIWRDTGDGYIEKGPFEKEKTSVSLSERDYDDATGTATLEVLPRSAGQRGRVHYDTHPEVGPVSPVWPEAVHTTDATVLHFRAIDPDGQHEMGPVVTWQNRLNITHEVQKLPDRILVTLTVKPRGIIRWNTEGITPRDGKLYESPIVLRDRSTIRLTAYAEDQGVSSVRTFTIPGLGEDKAPIDPQRPLVCHKVVSHLSTADSFKTINTAKAEKVQLSDVSVKVGTGDKTIHTRFGSQTRLNAEILEKAIGLAREALADPQAEVQITIKGMEFPTGHAFQQFAKATALDVSSSEIEQS